MQKPFDHLLPVEREFLLKQRANVLDQLALLEKRLGMPSSVMDKQSRRDERRKSRDDCDSGSR